MELPSSSSPQLPPFLAASLPLRVPDHGDAVFIYTAATRVSWPPLQTDLFPAPVLVTGLFLQPCEVRHLLGPDPHHYQGRESSGACLFRYGAQVLKRARSP